MEIAYKNILTVNVEKDGTFKVIDGRIRQYDYGKILRIQGIRLPAGVKIEFSTQASRGETVTRIGLSKNGVTEVTFPDEIIENGYNSSNYIVYVFVYLTNEGGGETVYKMNFFIESRPKPQAFDRPEDGQLFAEAIEVFNRTAAAVKESEKAAEGWAHGREDMPERTVDNAKYYSDQAKKDALQTGKDKQDVEELIKQTSGIGQQVEEVKENALKAIESERNAKLSEQNTKLSEEQAKLSEQNAKLSEEQAELSEQNAGKYANLAKDAADEIAADRDQIRKNASELDKKAEMIVNTAFGESMVLIDSSEKSLIGLSLYGKSTQVKTTGANLANGMDNIYYSAKTENEVKRRYCWGYSLGSGPLVLEKELKAGTYTFSLYCDAIPVIYFAKSPYVTGQFIQYSVNRKVVGDVRNGLQRYFVSFQLTDEKDILGIYSADYTTCFGGMINSGDEPLPYEPYTGGTPSPSIKYPQEITSVGDDGGLMYIQAEKICLISMAKRP